MKSLKKDIPTLKWIFRIMGPGKKWMFIVTLLLILQGVAGTLYALVFSNVLGSASQGGWDNFFPALFGLLALTLISLGLQTLVFYVQGKGLALLTRRFREHMFRELMLRSYVHISAKHSGEWLARLSADTKTVPSAFLQTLPQLFGLAAQSVSALWALFFLLPEVAFLVVPGGIGLILISIAFRAKLQSLYDQEWTAGMASRTFMQERLINLTIVHAFSQEENSAGQAGRRMDEQTRTELRSNRWVTFYRFIMRGAMRGGYLICIVLCGLLLLRGKIGYETLIAVPMLVSRVASPVSGLTDLAPQYFSMIVSAKRMMEAETYPLDCMEEPHGQEAVRSYYAQRFSALGIHHGSFAYDGDETQTVLSDFEMEIRKNQFVAFLGASGCGKSTVLKLFLSLYPLQEGEVYLRDTDGNEHTLDAVWRGLFAYVPQGNQLLSGTIKEAVTFGAPNLMQTEQDIWDALRVACAEDFVRELPDGLDNVLGEGGTGLSEGQMQRIAIARAVFFGRPILLLDEATSALDGETERQLLRNLRTMTDRTVILVTHRPAAAEICDMKIEFPSLQ